MVNRDYFVNRDFFFISNTVQERLSGFKLLLDAGQGETTVYTDTSPTAPANFIPIDSENSQQLPLPVQTLTVHLYTTNPLTICELQVFGKQHTCSNKY